MKKIIILFLSILLVSCQTSYKQPKEYYQTRNRTYQAPYDSVLKKIVEFAAQSKIPAKIITTVPGLVLIEEDLNGDQTYKYTDYDPKKYNADVQESLERLLISIKSDSTKTFVDIKSVVTANISYLTYMGKGAERVNKELDCISTGVREKEILDFIGNNSLNK